MIYLLIIVIILTLIFTFCNFSTPSDDKFEEYSVVQRFDGKFENYIESKQELVILSNRMLFLSNDDAKYIVYFKKNVNDMRSCKKHVGMKAVKMADDSTVDIVLHNGDTIHFETPNAKKLYVLLNSF